MYHSFLIHLSADGHLGCFHVLAIIKSAAITLGYTCLFQFWFPWCVCPGVGLLGHMAVLFPVYSFIAAAAAKSLQLCLTLCDPIDGSPPGSPVPGILQARTLEWVAISFSNAWVHAKSLQSCLILCDPIDGCPPGSSVHRILQARILEWVAISFSDSFTDEGIKGTADFLFVCMTVFLCLIGWVGVPIFHALKTLTQPIERPIY